ncbi:MAG: low temperature requirement protein A [Acidimicrobiales bacterium]
MAGDTTTSLLRDRSQGSRVTNAELFFDLVYAFAVTQLSHQLLDRPTATGALQAAVLLAMVWFAWAYTAWVTNWLDPDRIPIRLLLLGLGIVSLVMSAALPDAFGSRGLAVGAAYAGMQVGRTIFAVWALRGQPLQRNFQRILTWCLVSGALAVAGGVVHGSQRDILWLAAVVVDLLGGWAGFYTPGLGRSATSEWDIEGSHIAERCQAFVLIALGECVVLTGTTLSREPHVTSSGIAALAVAFCAVAALWWLYFDRSAEAASQVVSKSADPGRLGRTAYHVIHPAIVGGIIAAAAGNEELLAHPAIATPAPAAWMILGGTGLFVAGHAAFKRAIWGVIPWSRIYGVMALALLSLVAPHVDTIAVGVLAAAVVIAIAVSDRMAVAPTA